MPYDRFGGTIGMSGEKIIVGIHGDDSAGNDAGAVFIFDYVDLGLEVDPEPFSVEPNSGLKISSHAKIKTGEFSGLPRQTQLLSNYPNPFNPETWIPFQLAQPTSVILKLYDFEGKVIRTINLGYKKIGFYTATDQAIYWDGKNQLGEPVSSGVYFYRLTTSDYDAMKKMVILR
nr:T9SS type A sorting domain-containing protein [Candidatus Poribacteria bacterium]